MAPAEPALRTGLPVRSIPRLRRRTAGALVLLLGLVAALVTAPGATAADAGDGAVTVEVPEISLEGPRIADVDVTVHNGSTAVLRSGTVTFRGPVGWQVEDDSQRLGTVKPGRSSVVTFRIRVPEPRPGFRIRTFTATADYRGADGAGTAVGTRSVVTGDPLPDVASAYDNVGITSESDTAPGNFDGGGNSFSAEKLAEAGAGRGATLEALGATLTMPDVAPGTPDNATASGQAIEVDAAGSRLVLLGSGSSYGAAGLLTVHYTDGTTSSGNVGFPNWSFQEPDAHGATLVVSTDGRNRPDGYGDAAYQYRVFANAVPLEAGKEVDFVVLPASPTMHVFDLAVAP